MADESDKRFPRDVTPRPFQTYDQNFKPELQTPFDVFSASKIAGAEDLKKRQENSNSNPIAVSLPPHLFIPADAQSIDLRELWNIEPGTQDFLIMSFKAPKGGFAKFISYGVYLDALLFDQVSLVPTVDGTRVFPFHGNPNRNYKIGLGTGADLSNQNLISCQLDLQPGQTLEWRFSNNDVVDVAVGVRMSGYFDQSTIRKTGRFGG